MYTQVTVNVNNIATQDNAIKAALNYAQALKAKVTAVYIKLSIAEILRWQGNSPIDFANQMLADLDQREMDAKKRFEQLAQSYQCETSWRSLLDADNPIKEMLCTDLFFVDQPSQQYSVANGNREFLNSLVLETKRPVVMIPRGWDTQAHFGQSVVLGWNSSPEAMRASSDAIALLKTNAKVTVVDVLTPHMSRSENKGVYHIQDFLTFKNIENQLLIDACERQSEVPRKLIEVAKNESADLIVIGGYGHSRIREVILGGVTDHLIKHSPVPVFLSH